MIACDLGSNSLRIVQLDCNTGRRVKEFERMVKTADGITQTGMISDATVERIISAINEAKRLFDLSKAHAVTTAAMRMATNRLTVLRRIKEATGVAFIVIEPDEEALLTSLAVEWRLKIVGHCHDNYLLMDLGGGSTEMILHAKGEKRVSSFQVGIVTMAEKYKKIDNIKEGIDFELKALIKGVIRDYKALEKPAIFVATSGTPTTIAAFKQGLDYANYDVEKINGTSLSISDLDEVLGSLMSMRVKERERWVGVGRDRVIFTGIMMVKAIMIGAGFIEMIVIDDGLREGVALEKCKNIPLFSTY